jgi:hypothetical protein
VVPGGESVSVDLFTAVELRDAGMALADEAEPDAWKLAADLAIEILARWPESFTAEDVRRLAGDPLHPNAMGPRLQAAARANVIREVGYTTGERPLSRARVLRVYRGVQ